MSTFIPRSRKAVSLPVCIGFDTALQIRRTINPHSLVLLDRKHRLSPHAPRRNELDRAFAAIACASLGSPTPEPRHLLIGSASRCKPSNIYQPHMCTSMLPRNSLYLFEDCCLIATPELAFVQMATLLPFVKLIELGYELCGTYWRDRIDGLCRYQTEPITSVKQLGAFAERNPSLPGSRKVQRAMRYITDNSASPRETKLATVLALPTRRGGYGLAGFRMNYEITATRAARAIANRGSFRCDICWPDEHIDLEYQSREMHSGEISRISDSRRANALSSMSWQVTGITNDELDSLTATDVIVRSLKRLLKRSNRTQVESYFQRKANLRAQLGLPYEGSRHYLASWEEAEYGRIIGRGKAR